MKDDTLIQKFVREALVNSGPFQIEGTDVNGAIAWLHCMQNPVGHARYVYGSLSTSPERQDASVSFHPELAAIVSGGMVYIVNGNLLGLRRDEKRLPKCAERLDSFVDEANRIAREDIFPKFYEELPVTEPDARTAMENRSMARNVLFGITSRRPINLWPLFGKDDAAKFLCGFSTPEGATREILEADREIWIREKARAARIAEHVSTRDCVQDWELRLAEVLRASLENENNVTVEFSYHGKTATGKMSVENIWDNLVQEKPFHFYDFISDTIGSEVLDKLSAEDYRTDREFLTCENIVHLFDRKQNQIYEHAEEKEREDF